MSLEINAELLKARKELDVLSQRLEDMVEERTSALAEEITACKLREESLKKAAEELERLDDLKSNFISIAAHELRTPITSIKSAVDIVLRRKAGEISETQGKFLLMAERNIIRLANLVDDLVTISMIESGKVELYLTKIDLRQLIEKVLHTLQPLADKKYLSLNFNASDDLPSMHVDADKTEQVLINLVSNAIKFTPEKGVVTIGAHRTGNVPGMPDGVTGYVEISVADTGIGIPEESKEYLFEKFYQVEHSLLKKEEGTGLGLAISKGIVEAHQGKIRFESNKGEGSTFTFTLPIIDMEKQFYITLNIELSKAKQSTMPLSFLSINVSDIDNVMKVYGETDKEKVLNMIKEKIVSFGLKATDKIAVFLQSNEIMLILPETDRAEAEALLRRIDRDFLKDEAVIGKYTNTFITSISTYPEDETSEK